MKAVLENERQTQRTLMSTSLSKDNALVSHAKKFEITQTVFQITLFCVNFAGGLNFFSLFDSCGFLGML